MISEEKQKRKKEKELVIGKAKQKQESEPPARSLRLDTTETVESTQEASELKRQLCDKAQCTSSTQEKPKKGSSPCPYADSP